MKEFAIGIALLAAPMSLCTQGGCADVPATGQATAALDGSGNYYGNPLFHDMFVKAAQDASISPLVYNDVTGNASEAKVALGNYMDVAARIGAPVSLSGANIATQHIARFGTEVFTPSTITAGTSSDIKALLFGNVNGNATTKTNPSGCATSFGGTSGLIPFVPADSDPAMELLDVHWSVPLAQGMYRLCRGAVQVWRDSGGLHGQQVNGSGNVVAFTLTPTCASTDSANTCIGKQGAVSGQIAFGSKLAKQASDTLPTIDTVAQSDATFRNGGGAPLADWVNLVTDTNQTDATVDPIVTQATVTDKATAEGKLVGAGATSCDPLHPINC